MNRIALVGVWVRSGRGDCEELRSHGMRWYVLSWGQWGSKRPVAEWPQSHRHHHGGYSVWHLVLFLPGESPNPHSTG